jgi:hypothetical protein
MASERAHGDPEGYAASQRESSARLGDVMGDLGRKLREAGEKTKGE